MMMLWEEERRIERIALQLFHLGMLGPGWFAASDEDGAHDYTVTTKDLPTTVADGVKVLNAGAIDLDGVLGPVVVESPYSHFADDASFSFAGLGRKLADPAAAPRKDARGK